ncbi:MAG: PH domain-containing protein [Ilumatobacteraceae bacterium]
MTAPDPPTTGPGDAPGSDGVPERHLHPLSPVVTAAFALLRAWPIVLLAIARGALILLVGLALVLLVWRALAWLRTTYEIGEDGLVVRSGILWRTTQVVPPQRVQQVEVRSQIRHQVLGLGVVRVGLAGSGGTGQVELDALSLGDAEQLGARLERWRQQAGGAPSAVADLEPGSPLPPPPAGSTPATPAAPLLRIGLGQLVVAGLTSRSLWLAPLAALAAVVQLTTDAGLGDESTDAVATGLAEMSPAVLLAGVMVLALGIAAVTTVVTHYDLAVHRSGDDLVVRRGLLEKRSVTVPRRRVQYVVLADNVVRRRFDLASIDARTADLGGGGDDASTSSTSIPIGARDDIERLAGEFLPGLDPPQPIRHPAAAVRRMVVRRCLRLVPLSALVGLLVSGPAGAALAAGIGLVAGIVSGWMAGRRLRSGWNEQVIVTEHGVAVWRRSVVPAARVQSVGVVQTPFQRRLGLASVRLDVAGSVGGIEVRDLATADAHRLAQMLGMRFARV